MLERDIKQGIFQGEGHTCLSTSSSDSLYEIIHKFKIGFSCKALNCAQHTHTPLTLSDRAEIFITDTLKYHPEVKLAVLISDDCIRIYRVLKARNSVLARTFKYFFIKKEVRFSKKLKTTSDI
jgi:hypothetical protein